LHDPFSSQSSEIGAPLQKNKKINQLGQEVGAAGRKTLKETFFFFLVALGFELRVS
jgi:hypothetical protein